MEHTPGPWKISSSTLIITEEGRIIANCTPFNVIPEIGINILEAIENARLIAKAPQQQALIEELVGALKEVELECMASWCGIDPITICPTCKSRKKIQEIIAKAENSPLTGDITHND